MIASLGALSPNSGATMNSSLSLISGIGSWSGGMSWHAPMSSQKSKVPDVVSSTTGFATNSLSASL